MNRLAKTLFIIGFISVFIPLQSYAEDIYKSVDESGAPSFSDTKTEGAEVITVEPVNVQTILTAPPPSYKHISTEASFSYKTLAITSPADQTTLRNEHSILLQAAIEPSLKTDHHLEFLDNGQALKAAGKHSSIELVNLARGTHTLTARIVDKSNRALKTSIPVTVYVFRTTALAH